VSGHATPANHEVFERQHDGVTQVQEARGVGRRHGDGEGGPVGGRVGYERARLFPHFIDLSLALCVFEVLGECHPLIISSKDAS
jgi:hypothetical protein